jgi:hypothetical protein
MRSVLILCVVALSCGDPAPEPRLLGAWKSNYELTISEFRSAPDVTAEQLELLSDPELFGHMIAVYGPKATVVIYGGECALTPYEVVSRSDTYVDIRYDDALLEERTTRRIFFENGIMWIPVGKAREIFTLVDLEAVKAEHECLEALLDETG